MQLDRIAVNIRPRNPWEAIDMGFVLARKWFLKLWLLWLLTSVPYCLLAIGLGIMLPGAAEKWALVLFWFFKPFYELPAISWVSRALFGEPGKILKTIAGDLKKTTLKQRLRILLNRFSLYRSFFLPVLLLEALKGKAYRNRLALLKDGYETAAFLTMAGVCIEWVLTFSVISILYWFIPEDLRWVDFGDFVFRPDGWLLLLGYIAGCSIFAPLYVCAGFMLYISRRVILEAWDIEIGFKAIRQRLLQTLSSTLMVVFIYTAVLLMPALADAQNIVPETAKSEIAKVLDQNDFGKKITQYRWVPKKKDEPDSDDAEGWLRFLEALEKLAKKVGPLLAKAGELILWIAVGFGMAYLLLRYLRLRGWPAGSVSTGKTTTAPEMLFGMDLRPESLPEDIEAHCRQLLEDGRKREAVSLLYRGTLGGLLNTYPLEILTSFTEKECYREVKRCCSAAEAAFFNQLTSLWVLTAYGHREPATEACRGLIGRWQSLFGGAV